MEHAPLRPVPGRPRGPLSDADAVRAVAAVLPAIGAREGLALALVALVGRTRAEVMPRVGLAEEALGQALVVARKELRRTVTPLPGSGWCERAERLISDRMDGALAERDVLRLDVHLRNCPRCVEHERRLVQATDGLMAGLTTRGVPPEGALLEVAEGQPAGVPAAAEPEAAETAATKAEPAEEAGPGGPEPGVAEADRDSGQPDGGAGEPDDRAPEHEDAAGSDRDAVELDGDAAEAGAQVVARSRREVAVALSWRVLFSLAVLLAIASLALAVAGILGADL